MMNELRKTIHSMLHSIHDRVFFQVAPDSAEFPYLVFSVESTNLGEELHLVSVDVDGWDNRDDTSRLEILMDQVTRELDRSLVISDDLYLRFYLDRQLALDESEIGLHRRTNIFNARHYERT